MTVTRSRSDKTGNSGRNLNAGLFYHLYSRMTENAYCEHLGMLHFNRGGLPFEIALDLEEDSEL